MILDVSDITRIIRTNPYKDCIKTATEQHDVLYMHCTGKGIDGYVKDIKEFMRDGARDTLKDLMRSNRDLIYRVMAPRDKIYTAKGGFENYILPEDKEDEFREYLSNVADGLPIKDWIRLKLQMHYDYDPNGVILIEINADNIPYPSIKSITDIYDYMPNGRALEYLVLSVSEDEKASYMANGLLPTGLTKRDMVYRVIDDTNDRLCYFSTASKNADITVTSEIPNEFGYVPAMIISDLVGYGEQCFDSPLSPSVELLNEYMFDAGNYKWAYMRNAWPKEWMQQFPCPKCKGEKQINAHDCPQCKGSGILPFLRHGDVMSIDYRGEGGKDVPNPPAGHVPSDIPALQFMFDNNVHLEDYFDFTIWGVSKVQSGKGITKPAGKGGNVSNTAYEAQQNEQPRHDRLKLFTKWKDSVQAFIADTCGWYLYRADYQGCAIIGGDRFMIESPDATWDRYTKAVAAKAPQYALDTLLTEYNENKFNGNPLQFRKAELLRQVEPFVHEDISVIWPDQTLPLIVRMEKKYFDEWTNTISDYDIANTPDVGGADILRGQLRDWITGKFIADVQASTLLINNSGSVLKIGAKVKILDGKEKKLEHKGVIYTVSDIVDENVTLSGGGVDGLFGYSQNDISVDGTQMRIG